MMGEPQIRGLLLEEAVLHLLRRTGYEPIASAGSDPTLAQEGEVVYVRGRGERHQIDAIADYLVQPPFSNPLRLLVEAKFYDDRRVGLTVVRNALGVLSDVCQHFVSAGPQETRKIRYHYQYAVVSATKFSPESQRYAYAHDIFLIPLGESTHFESILNAIREAAAHLVSHPRNRNQNNFSVLLRTHIRGRLWWGDGPNQQIADLRPEDETVITRLLEECERIGYVLVAVTTSGFPIFLVPNPEIRLSAIPSALDVRIFRAENGWAIFDASNRRLFSLDIPKELARLYSRSGELSPGRALDLKDAELRFLRTTIVTGQTVQNILLRLDDRWFDSLNRGER